MLVFIPAYLGIRFGTGFATVLALLSMIPLTFIAVAWIFHPWVAHFGELSGFHHLDGTSFFSVISGHNWLQSTSPTVPADLERDRDGGRRLLHRRMQDPERDAKIAMNLEGGYGLFIYTLIPIAFVVVLGAKALSNSALVDPKTIFVEFAGKIFPGMGGALLIGWSRSCWSSRSRSRRLTRSWAVPARCTRCRVDGAVPALVHKINHHGVPDRAMFFNVICSLILILAGGAVQIYSFSNVGYVFSFIPVLIGYYLLRKDKPNMRRPFVCRSSSSTSRSGSQRSIS